MSVSTITRALADKKMNYQKAYAILANSLRIEDLPIEELDAIRFLIARCATKENAAIKPTDSPFKLASLFVAKQDPRFYLTGIHSDGNCLRASNGHVAIEVSHQHEPGVYDALGIRIPGSDDWRLPDMKQVFQGELVDVEDWLNGDVRRVGDTVYRQVGPAWYCVDYLALINRTRASRVRVNTSNKLMPLVFEGDNFQAVIMPMRE